MTQTSHARIGKEYTKKEEEEWEGQAITIGLEIGGYYRNKTSDNAFELDVEKARKRNGT